MPLTLNPLLTLAVILVLGEAFGALARRVHLPSMSGQILVGVLIGPSVFHVFGHDTVHALRPITHFALGLMTVAVGNHLHIPRLRNAFKRLTLLLLLEITITPLFVMGSLLVVPGTSWIMGLLLAALSVATGSAPVLAVVKETRSKGVFVKTLIAAVALNNVACVAMFEVAHAAARVSLDPAAGGVFDVLTAPFHQLGASIVIGGGLGVLLTLVTRRMMNPAQLTTATLITILLAVGVADFLHVSTLLSCLFLGVTLANFTPEREEVGPGVFDNIEAAILTVFFTLAGMEFDFSYAVPGGLLAILIVVARLAGKVTAAGAAMSLAGATSRVRRYLGLALVPQAGVAVGLLLLLQEDPAFGAMGDVFLAVGLTIVTLNEIVGPILLRLALSLSGDLGKDRARLIDFINEENIVTDFRAETKEEAIGKLTDLLIRSHDLDVDRDALLRSVLQREEEFSTCVGNGLAIPHGTLEDGAQMRGVMALSREGLPFDTPDGVPVHCMVLLATPPAQRDRHLEVIAALAKAVTRDRNVQRQLFNAKSAAHAYDILHAEEGADFNYFLDEGAGA